MGSINGDHLFVNANAFRDWAKEQVEGGHEDVALALKRAGVDGAKDVRAILQADATDSSKSVEHLMKNNADGTKEQRRVANAETRKIFLSFIKQSCGLKDSASLDQLPENVRKAMKLTGFFHKNDWFEGSSRPLTARRINAVMKELDAMHFNENLSNDIKNGMAFHTSSLFGRNFLSQWGDVPSGSVRALLNNVSQNTLEKMAKPLTMLGTGISKRQVLLVLNYQQKIQELMEENELTPSALFKTMYGEAALGEEKLEIPKDLLKAEKKGDRKAVADVFKNYGIKELEDAKNIIMNDTRKTQAEKGKLLNRLLFASQISSQRPVYLAKCFLEGKEYNEDDFRMNEYEAPITSTKVNASLAVDTFARQMEGNNEISVTFVEDMAAGKEVIRNFQFKRVKNEQNSQKEEASKAFEAQVNQFCRGAKYNKGLLYAAFKSDDGLNRLVRQIGHAKTGNMKIKGIEGGNYTVEKRTDGVLKLTLTNRKNTRLNCKKTTNAEANGVAAEKNNEYDSFNVDYEVQILLYPDGRQKVLAKHANYTAVDLPKQNEPLPGISLGDPVELPDGAEKQVFML